MKNIILICRGEISSSPTVQNYLIAFQSLGYGVSCICSSNNNNLLTDIVDFHEIGSAPRSGILNKIISYYSFRKKALKKLSEVRARKEENIVWVSRIDTAICLGSEIRSMRAVLALHELHDEYPFWRLVTKKIIHQYDNTVLNEVNRANIVRVWYKLPYTPSIIPNKPPRHPRQRKIPINDEAVSSLLASLGDRKILLYQGSLMKDRNIEPLVEACRNLGDEFVLVLMGKDEDNRIGHLRSLNKDLIHIPWVVPPDHLHVTSHAYIGFAFYDYDCLNSIYCAPNKIWEYSGFSIPVIGQNIPGLINTVGANEFGECVNIENASEIINSIKKIEDKYASYSKKARAFYDSTDFVDLAEKALKREP